MAKRSTSKRELIDMGRNKMFAKRNAEGQFKEMDDVGRSLSADRPPSAKRSVMAGHGDQGDRKRTAARGAKKKQLQWV
jgi:hypothetical protein